jgi:hypothetical protein
MAGTLIGERPYDGGWVLYEWLGTQDSNLDLRSQSPLSYH